MSLDLNIIVDVYDLRKRVVSFQVVGAWSENSLSCFDNLIVIDGVFNLNLFMDIYFWSI